MQTAISLFQVSKQGADVNVSVISFLSILKPTSKQHFTGIFHSIASYYRKAVLKRRTVSQTETYTFFPSLPHSAARDVKTASEPFRLFHLSSTTVIQCTFACHFTGEKSLCCSAPLLLLATSSCSWHRGQAQPPGTQHPTHVSLQRGAPVACLHVIHIDD